MVSLCARDAGVNPSYRLLLSKPPTANNKRPPDEPVVLIFWYWSLAELAAQEELVDAVA